MMCLHTLGAKPYYTVYSATLSLHHLQFLPPDDVVISLGSRFTRTEAAMYMSLYGFLPRHFQEPGDLNHPTDTPTIYTLLKHYLHHDKIPSDIPTPRPAVRHFTDTEAALYLSLTATLPPYYTYDDTSYTAPHPTTCGRATNQPHSLGTPPFHDTTPTCSTTLPEIICYPLDTSSLTNPFTPPPSTSNPTPTHTANPQPDESALPPPPSLDTPANHQYPDPTLSHTPSRTLAMRCLRETSSTTPSATTILDMNNALDQAISDTTSELRTIETTLPRIDHLLTNLQRYNTYLRSRQQDARQIFNHLNAVRAVIATILPDTSTSGTTPLAFQSTHDVTIPPDNPHLPTPVSHHRLLPNPSPVA